MLRKQGQWMSKWDDRLLEFIHENGSGAPTEISNSDFIPISKQYASKRLKELEENDLLESLGNGVYKVSVNGLLYLYGDYDAETGEILADIDTELEEWSGVAGPEENSVDERLERVYSAKLTKLESDDKLRELIYQFIGDD